MLLAMFVQVDIIKTHPKNALFVQVCSRIVSNATLKNANNAKITHYMLLHLENANHVILIIITAALVAQQLIAFLVNLTCITLVVYAKLVIILCLLAKHARQQHRLNALGV
jgi:hypothetical protein